MTAAERIMWRYSRAISRTCCTAEDWRKVVCGRRCWYGCEGQNSNWME